MQITNALQSTNNVAADLGQPRQCSKGTSRQSAGEDQVQISSLALQLASSDPSKLSQLQAAYGAGTYDVSPSQIANSILNDALQH
jgi:anti-sigma28 factor (negative regulator of flagellin synthesis)